MSDYAQHIPPEVVEGYCRHRYGTDWEHVFNDKEREIARRNARAAIAAALTVWPHALIERGLMADPYKVPSLILPLAQEPGK